MTKQQHAAHKAWNTIRARNLFRKKYGEVSYNAAKAILTDNKQAMDEFFIPELAAYKANLNRPGLYRTLAASCNF